MIKDRQANPLRGATTEAAAAFDGAIEAFNLYHGDPVALLDTALDAAPQFAMAHIAKAYLLALATEPDANTAAIAVLEHAKAVPLGDRERSHVAALDRKSTR